MGATLLCFALFVVYSPVVAETFSYAGEMELQYPGRPCPDCKKQEQEKKPNPDYKCPNTNCEGGIIRDSVCECCFGEKGRKFNKKVTLGNVQFHHPARFQYAGNYTI